MPTGFSKDKHPHLYPKGAKSKKGTKPHDPAKKRKAALKEPTKVVLPPPEVVEQQIEEILGTPPSTRPENQPKDPARGFVTELNLRDDFNAQLIVPRNITVQEARRLAAFVMSLVID